MWLLLLACDFFLRFLESRNYKIQIRVHVEGKSVALLSGILEASYRLFFIGQGFNCSRSIWEGEGPRRSEILNPRDYEGLLWTTRDY